MKPTKLVAGAVALGLVAAACGDDDPDPVCDWRPRHAEAETPPPSEGESMSDESMDDESMEDEVDGSDESMDGRSRWTTNRCPMKSMDDESMVGRDDGRRHDLHRHRREHLR